MATEIIEATLPGVVYLSRSPEEAVFKQPGDRVEIGDTIALIEVMKAFMPIEAEVAGTLLRYAVENEAAIDVGDTICEIEV